MTNRRRRILESKRKYAQSAKGKAKRKKYMQTAKYKAGLKRHQQSAKYKAQQKRYQQSAKGKAKCKKYAQSFKCKAWRKKYRQSAKHIEYVNTRKAKACVAASQAARRAKRFGAPGKWTGAQFLRLCAQHGNVCLCCGKKKPLGPDHVVPFCSGGNNELANIQPLCFPCNLRKGDKTTDYRKARLSGIKLRFV